MERVFVANRGEIAVRIIRACRDLGIRTVLGYSQADRNTYGVRLADEAICIGDGPSHASYLSQDRILMAALVSKCDALHPGYGFFAENADFAKACRDAGLVFVGPNEDAIALLGDKIAARRIAQESNIPTVPGGEFDPKDLETAAQLAEDIGYPVLIKSAGGGGGKGLRKVEHSRELEGAIGRAYTESNASTVESGLFMEKYIKRARHVEIQVAGDAHGNVAAIGDRDCSIQRRYQKLIEEAPASLSEEERRSMFKASRRLCEAVGYRSLGTVEFLYDVDNNAFYFIEMNTRLQVEHGVTELVSDIDLVTLQLDLARGKGVSEQELGASRGHAIEFRINSEDPDLDYRPGAGTITRLELPSGPWVRVDTHCYEGYRIPPYYDSLLAKIMVYGRNREEAVRRSRRVLQELRLEGMPNTTGKYRAILENAAFEQNTFDVSSLERGDL